MAKAPVLAIALVLLLSTAVAVNAQAAKIPAAKAAAAKAMYLKNIKAAVAYVGAKPGYKLFPQLFQAALSDPEAVMIMQQKLTMLVPHDKALQAFNISQFTPMNLFHILTAHALLDLHPSAALIALPKGKKLPTANKVFKLTKFSAPGAKKLQFKARTYGQPSTVLNADMYSSATCIAHGVDKILMPPAALL